MFSVINYTDLLPALKGEGSGGEVWDYISSQDSAPRPVLSALPLLHTVWSSGLWDLVLIIPTLKNILKNILINFSISIAKVSLYFISKILQSVMFPYIIYCLRPEDFNSIDERIQRVFKHGDIMLKYSPHDEYIIYISYEIKNKCGDVYDFGNLAFNLKPLVLDSVPLKNILTKILRNVLRNKNEFESKLPQYIEY